MLVAGLSEPVATYLPDYLGASEDPEKQAIHLEHLLDMKAGLQWDEWTGDSVTFMVLSPDHTGYVLGQPLAAAPGTEFTYSTGLACVGSAVLTKATGLSTLDFARESLFDPIGITAPRWDTAPEGFTIGGELWLRGRDLLRFGELFRMNGLLDGNQILPEWWVKASQNTRDPILGGAQEYGLWWRKRPFAHYRAGDAYFAWGYGGQFLFIFPDLALEIVVLSKWEVSAAEDSSTANAIFDLVDGQILPLVTPY